MNLLRLLAMVFLLGLLSSTASANDRVFGPFSSEIGQLRFEVSDGTAVSAGSLRVQLEVDVRKQLWSTVYSCQSDYVIYVLPLSPDASSFLIAENLGSGYRTVILHVESIQSVVMQLDAARKDFPEIIRVGVERTQFVIIPNASKTGDFIDVMDIYALQNGVYKLEKRVPYGQALTTVQQLSRMIDRVAAERRRGVVVHP